MLLVRCSYLWGSTNILLTFKNLTGRGPDGKKNPGDRTFENGKSTKNYRRKRSVTFKNCLKDSAAVAFAHPQSKQSKQSSQWVYYRLLDDGSTVSRGGGPFHQRTTSVGHATSRQIGRECRMKTWGPMARSLRTVRAAQRGRRDREKRQIKGDGLKMHGTYGNTERWPNRNPPLKRWPNRNPSPPPKRLRSFDMSLRLKHFVLMIINIDIMSHDLLSCTTNHNYLSKHFKTVKTVRAAGAKSSKIQR